MTEPEFEDLLERVGEAVACDPLDCADPSTFFDSWVALPPRAANDNPKPWPYLPFPAGWTASC